MLIRPTGVVITLFGVLGCGGGVPPQSAATLAQTEAAIRAATEVGAEQVPQAALHLRYANDQFEDARKMLGNGDQYAAQLMMKRAQADAELSLALARQARAQQEVEQARRTLRAMQSPQEQPQEQQEAVPEQKGGAQP